MNFLSIFPLMITGAVIKDKFRHLKRIAGLNCIYNKKSLEEAAEEHNKTEKATELEVREFAKNNPEITAALIRSMLKERE